MEEHQVHPKPLVADPHPFLSADKRKFVTEFEQESFEVSDECLFQIAFGVFVFKAKKFEDERIADFFVGGNRITRYGFLTFHQHRRFVFRQCRALVKLRVDLPVKLPNRPAARQRLANVELARVRIPHPQQPDVMRPRQRKGVGNRAEAFNRTGCCFSNHRLENFRFSNH